MLRYFCMLKKNLHTQAITYIMKHFYSLALLAGLFISLNPLKASIPDAKMSYESGRQIAISKRGYCIISTMPEKPAIALVLYYNSRNELVRKEYRRISNVDTNRFSVKRSFRKSLKEATDLQTNI